MKVLIITGNLAYPLIKNVVANANVEVIIHIADNTQVAAFLTPRIIIDEIKTSLKDDVSLDMIELDLRRIWDLLGEIVGDSYSEELLDELFSKFCVGK